MLLSGQHVTSYLDAVTVVSVTECHRLLSDQHITAHANAVTVVSVTVTQASLRSACYCPC